MQKMSARSIRNSKSKRNNTCILFGQGTAPLALPQGYGIMRTSIVIVVVT